MNRLIIFSTSILILTNCTIREKARSIADEYCNCCNQILSDSTDLVDKRSRLENCNFDYMTELDKYEVRTKDKLIHMIQKRINENCVQCVELDSMYKIQRKISETISEDKNKCKEFFSNGKYIELGMQGKVTITRMDSLNIVEFPTAGYKSVYIVEWIDECSYNLILKETNRPDLIDRIGLQMRVNVIDIKNDIVDCEMIFESNVYSQKLERIKN